jgi:hypothetical protein
MYDGTLTDAGASGAHDARDALEADVRAGGTEFEDNGDGTLIVFGCPTPRQRDWVLMRYDDGGHSADGRGVIGHPKEVPDA